jgi:hypothetical protein
MKLFNENGHLTEYGKSCLDMFLGKEISNIMNTEDTVQGLQTLKAAIGKYVGDRFSERAAALRADEPR